VNGAGAENFTILAIRLEVPRPLRGYSRTFAPSPPGLIPVDRLVQRHGAERPRRFNNPGTGEDTTAAGFGCGHGRNRR
jgi:hypothetical protein